MFSTMPEDLTLRAGSTRLGNFSAVRYAVGARLLGLALAFRPAGRQKYLRVNGRAAHQLNESGRSVVATAVRAPRRELPPARPLTSRLRYASAPRPCDPGRLLARDSWQLSRT